MLNTNKQIKYTQSDTTIFEVKHPKIHLYFNEAAKILTRARKINMCVCYTCDFHLCYVSCYHYYLFISLFSLTVCVSLYISKHSSICPVTCLDNIWLSFAAEMLLSAMPKSIMELNAYFAVAYKI